MKSEIKGILNTIKLETGGVIKMTTETEQEYNSNGKLIKDSIKNKDYTVGLLTHPTGNCQLFTYGYFNSLLFLTNWVEVLKDIIRNHSGKKLMLIDVHSRYGEIIDKEFKNIKFKSPYLSTNDSNMIIYLIDMTSYY